MRLPFAEAFGYQALVALLLLPTCSRAVPVTYCSPELSGTSNSSMSIYMSNGFCQNICQGVNTAFFVILGTDCWCTNYAPANQVPTFQCNTPCPGYPPDSCGNTTSNLYAYFSLQRRPSGTASAFTIASVPALPSAVSSLATSDSSTATSSATTSGEESASTTTSSIATSTTRSRASSFTNTDASDIALYLQTAIPASDRSQSSNACFLNSAYSYYSTPSWYEQFPTQVQSYYSSSAQDATAACTLSANQVSATSANRSSGLSTGAKAGIAVGVIVAVLLVAALLFLCFRRRKRRRRNEAVTNGKADVEHEKAAIPATAYADTHPASRPHYPARSDDEDFTALPDVPPSAHMQATHPAFMGAAQGRHKDDSIQSTPPMSEVSRDENPPSKPWLNYANQRTRSEMSEDQQFFPALQQQNPYQLDPDLNFGTQNSNRIPRRPVGGVGQTVHAGGTTGGFGFSDTAGYESGGERSWYHAR